MPSLQRTLSACTWIPVVCASLALSAALMPLAAHAQEAASAEGDYVVAQQLSAEQISAPDQAIIRAKKKEIADEADFFGYDLSAGNWSYEQSVCPEMPEHLLLHYRSQSRNGAESLFTAIVPRASGRVFVVPVLYRNATPFQSAVGSPRTIGVFNRVVPAEAARQAVEPEGKWLQLGMCFAEVAGSDPKVPQRAVQDPGLVQAPLPTLHMNAGDSTREIIFTDRNAPGGYLVWTIFLDKNGRVTSASTRSVADYVGHGPSEQEPKVRVMPEGTQPKEKERPAGSTPPAVSVPH